MSKLIPIILIATGLFYSSCCPFVKEEYLGNNLYLSEYSHRERAILYQEERCSSTGIEIVPMTVLEIAYNGDWIIAKSGSEHQKSTFEYWIIKNNYEVPPPPADTIKAYTIGPVDYETFTVNMENKNIELTLEPID